MTKQIAFSSTYLQGGNMRSVENIVKECVPFESGHVRRQINASYTILSKLNILLTCWKRQEHTDAKPRNEMIQTTKAKLMPTRRTMMTTNKYTNFFLHPYRPTSFWDCFACCGFLKKWLLSSRTSVTLNWSTSSSSSWFGGSSSNTGSRYSVCVWAWS